MSRQKKNYSATFKVQVLLELLRGDKTLNELAEQYQIASAECMAQGLSGTGTDGLSTGAYSTG